MIDLYIKQNKGISMRIPGKDYTIMKTKTGDFVIVAFKEILFPLDKNGAEFEGAISELILSGLIECIIYEDGKLSYVYKLNQNIEKLKWNSESQKLHCPEFSSFH